MIVDVSDNLTLISVAFFRAVDFIDSGDTAVVRLTGADGNELAVMMPMRVAVDVARSLTKSGGSVAPQGGPETKS